MKTNKRIYILPILFMFFTAQAQAFPIFQEKEPEEAHVPIIMYHLITKNGRYQGKFGISPDEMEADLKYLSENGYETIVISDLVQFVEDWDSLPDKPVVLTFDDGSSSDYYYLYPLLEKYDMKAVLSIVGKFTDEYSEDKTPSKKPHLTWEQVKEMHKSGRVEIQNHSYNMHGNNGSGRKRGESDKDYSERLGKDLSKAQEGIKENIKFTPTTFTYPLGVMSKGSEEVLKELGFKASLSCSEGMSVVKQDAPECLFKLRRNIRRSGVPVSEVLRKLEKSGK